MAADLKAALHNDIKTAMRAKDKARLNALRLVSSAIKQREVDERTELDDAAVLGVLQKMLKQRRDSLAQYQAAGRQDLADRERFEIEVIEGFMPRPLDDEELAAIIDAAVAQTAAASMKDMGRVMGLVKSRTEGRADMARVSTLVKQRLGT